MKESIFVAASNTDVAMMSTAPKTFLSGFHRPPFPVRHAATILSGRALSESLLTSLTPDLDRLSDLGLRPTLVPIMIGSDTQSEIYIRKKTEVGRRIGVHVRPERLPQDVDMNTARRLLNDLNDNPDVHGVIVQLPLPSHLPELTLCNAVDPVKDVDGFTASNLGAMVQSLRATLATNSYIPCTALAVKHILRTHFADEDVGGRRAVVLGRSLNVGLPIAMILQADAEKGGFDLTTTICHRRTENLKDFTKDADIIVSAVGQAALIKPDMVKPGVVVIDVGLNMTKTESGKSKLVGDVHPDVAEVASAMTPVPGGVGPCTVAALMHNTVLAAKRALLTFPL